VTLTNLDFNTDYHVDFCDFIFLFAGDNVACTDANSTVITQTGLNKTFKGYEHLY